MSGQEVEQAVLRNISHMLYLEFSSGELNMLLLEYTIATLLQVLATLFWSCSIVVYSKLV